MYAVTWKEGVDIEEMGSGKGTTGFIFVDRFAEGKADAQAKGTPVRIICFPDGRAPGSKEVAGPGPGRQEKRIPSAGLLGESAKKPRKTVEVPVGAPRWTGGGGGLFKVST